MSDIKGRFLWYDLNTEDLDAARQFYSAVVGWTITPFSPDYAMFTAPDGPMGGAVQLAAEAKAMGAPPHWLAHIGTPDLDATLARLAELGGKAYTDSFDIPDVGRFAVVADPGGAVFGVFQPVGGMQRDVDAEPGTGRVVWAELMASDWQAAWPFYAELFGWQQTEAMDMGPMGTYQMFTVGTRRGVGGMMNKPAEMPMSAWGFYFDVPSLDAAIQATTDGGGQIINGPMTVPGGARVAMCVDPQGAFFGLHEVAQAAT